MYGPPVEYLDDAIEYLDDEAPPLTRRYNLRMVYDGLPKAIRYIGNVPCTSSDELALPQPPAGDAGTQPAGGADAPPPPMHTRDGSCNAPPPPPPTGDAGTQLAGAADAPPPPPTGDASTQLAGAAAPPPPPTGDAGTQLAGAAAPPPPPKHTREGSCNAILKGDSRRRCSAIKGQNGCHVDVHNRCGEEFFRDDRWHSCTRKHPCCEHAPKCGAPTKAGTPCSWPKETCTVHNADAVGRCESCSWSRDPCKLTRQPDCMYCKYHEAFPNQIRVLDELVIAHGIHVSLQQFLARFPGQEKEFGEIEFSLLMPNYVKKVKADIANGDDRVPPAVVDIFRKAGAPAAAATDASAGTAAATGADDMDVDPTTDASAGTAAATDASVGTAAATDANLGTAAATGADDMDVDPATDANLGTAAAATDANMDTGTSADAATQIVVVAAAAGADDMDMDPPPGMVPVLIRPSFSQAFTVFVEPGTPWRKIKEHECWPLHMPVRAYRGKVIVKRDDAINAATTITLHKQSTGTMVVQSRNGGELVKRRTEPEPSAADARGQVDAIQGSVFRIEDALDEIKSGGNLADANWLAVKARQAAKEKKQREQDAKKARVDMKKLEKTCQQRVKDATAQKKLLQKAADTGGEAAQAALLAAQEALEAALARLVDTQNRLCQLNEVARRSAWKFFNVSC